MVIAYQVSVNAETVTVQAPRVIPFWYRGSMRVDPLKGNGRLTDLEQDIREFEQWARSTEAQS